MTARSSDVVGVARLRAPGSRFAREESGAALALVAIFAVVILGLTGLVIDLGIAYVNKAQLDRAVDAGVLAGARAVRNGTAVARAQALALAGANGASSASGESLSFALALNPQGENTVTMSATRPVPTIFLRAIGKDELDVGSTATAAIPPVDLVLVLDQSGSLRQQGAWDDLQDAAKEFVGNFDDDLDQMGLVSFQVRATDRFMIAHGFTSTIEHAIDAMSSDGYTNVGEGLRLALGQMQSGTVRARSSKVVVFFTDGRPTAFRGPLGPGGPVDGGSALGPFDSPTPGVNDRVMVVPTTATGRIAGYYDNPDQLPSDGLTTPDVCRNVGNCWGWTEAQARDKARDAGLEVANVIRSRGIAIYSIGLGNPHASALEQPDMAYLHEISNEGGATAGAQPRGRAYLAPSAVELRQVFDQVAQDLVVRLAS